MNTSLQITLTGTDPIPGDVLKFSVVGGPPQVLGKVTPGTTSNSITYTPKGGFIGTDSFTYKATTNNGQGVDSNIAKVTITVNAPPLIRINGLGFLYYLLSSPNLLLLLPPAGIQIISPSSTQVSISWNNATGATRYNIYRANSVSDNFSKVTSTPVRGTSFTDNHVSPSSHYNYYLTSVSAVGESSPSNTVPVKTPPIRINGLGFLYYLLSSPNLPLPLPPSLSPPKIHLNSLSYNHVNISWNSIPGAIGYNIYRVPSSSGKTSTHVIGTSITDTSVSPSTNYSYHVTSVSRTGEYTIPSNTVTVKTPSRCSFGILSIFSCIPFSIEVGIFNALITAVIVWFTVGFHFKKRSIQERQLPNKGDTDTKGIENG
jgi:hypothetical protein